MYNPSVWKKRWQALADILDEMCAVYTNVYTNPTFMAVSTSLKAFGGDQFEFFLKGFENGRLLPSPNFPPENILRATLDQVSYDITAVQQAVDQRNSNFPAMEKALFTADSLAQNALNLAVESKLIKQTAVITYFIKAANIRVIPYAPVAVVGVPYTCLKTSRDYLATAHEVGHYIYYHGEGIVTGLQNLLPSLPEWGAGWVEEIFADVYGCLVAGPVLGLDFQDLLIDNDLEHFIGSDGHHPVDAVRPTIYTKVLKELGFVHAAEALKQRWQEVLLMRGNPQSFYPDDEFGAVPMDLAKEFVQETAVTILNYLKKQGVPTNTTWTQDLSSPKENIDNLYQAFADKLTDLAKTPVNKLSTETAENKLFVLLPDGQKRNQRIIGHTQTWRDWVKTQSQTHDKSPLPPAIWIEIFTAGGWPVKGPEGSGGGG
ncbi:MAG: hypothetical protein IAF02_06160 [Anaerolineae bacterium]|nr:hypothetical protein [Anaerolineae bacterium]